VHSFAKLRATSEYHLTKKCFRASCDMNTVFEMKAVRDAFIKKSWNPNMLHASQASGLNILCSFIRVAECLTKGP
jgi:hypothetical protein